MTDSESLLQSIGSQESGNCSLIRQRRVFGRFGRTFFEIKQDEGWDFVLARAVHSTDRTTMKSGVNVLTRLVESRKESSEKERKEYDAALLRARLLSAELRSSLSMDDINRFISCEDPYILFVLGCAFQWGLYGIKEDEERARELFRRSEDAGFENAVLLGGPIGLQDKLKPGNREWIELICKLRLNRAHICELDLSSL